MSATLSPDADAADRTATIQITVKMSRARQSPASWGAEATARGFTVQRWRQSPQQAFFAALADLADSPTMRAVVDVLCEDL